ncbi:EscU/YscU/HrcU family type III secretion system export apparatus switch protein [Thermosipho ferrireducens]|uniref:EscU/YscU/HrcU family type III secretion system export apparatus switch protein n=1 Tax=Thermosipho ferrireducens TaxID=2571116 RepID=A0ABX7S5P7_9BACT|nr:EscU/YscU/HrcU family type III secretion system export apparatus switch protein [Thermosipho ferrireducens]QTA37887.1 EscU/YscU/HrcU family type III secretion system export apparatus switch protein [Thermosipho ferrireducens]
MESTLETKEIAVALKYEPEKDLVPFVVAKGKGKLAKKIIETAKKSKVPLIKSPQLVRELFKLNILEEIPKNLYVAVAEIIAYVESREKR